MVRLVTVLEKQACKLCKGSGRNGSGKCATCSGTGKVEVEVLR
ncbi:MAG: hypothetical protein R6W91_06575 [Thermoplasmata archaeon]